MPLGRRAPDALLRGVRFLPLLALAGCIGIPGPAPGDPDAGTEPATITCDRSLGELLPSPAFAPAPRAVDVVVADLDRDGLDDVVALLEPDRIAVARTRSEGGYDAPVEVALDSEVRALATVDFDGDGDLDVVAAGAVIVALRNDAGTLVEEARVSMMACVFDVLTIGQFDDDLRPDVAAGCTSSGWVMLLRHGETTPLGASAWIGSFPGLRGLTAGDDRDDLVVLGSGVELLQAIGGGSFATRALSDAASTAAASGDLDADGRDDVIVFVGDGLAWLRGAEKPGALVPLSIEEIAAPRSLELGAIDGAAGDDVVLVEGEDPDMPSYRTLLIASPLTNATVQTQPGREHLRCRLGRLDAADEPDLACVASYGPVLVPVYHREAAPADFGPLSAGAKLFQLDDDPAVEVLVTGLSVDMPLEVLEPAGDRFILEATGPSLIADPVAAVDWTGDHRPDLIVRAYHPDDADGAIELLPATTLGSFGTPIQLLDEAWIQLDVGDLDADGYPDLAGWTYSDAINDVVLHVAFGGANGTIADSIMQPRVHPFAIADVIEGGPPELIVWDADPGEIQIVDASQRTISIADRIATDAVPLEMVTSDLDRDGDTDLVTLESGASTTLVRTYVRDDDGRFQRVSSHPMHASYDADLVVADIDGDSAPDVIASALMLMRGQGDGRIAAPVPFARPGQLVGAVPAPAGAAQQIVYVAWSIYGFGNAVEMLAPGCR
jgi:hypothetical protein